MGLQFPYALLSALVLLFPVFPENTKASEEGSRSNSASTTVSLLFCLLLFLLLLLFLAWRKLNRDSQGKYHPHRLMRALVRRWQAFRGEEPPEELPRDSEDEDQREGELEEPEYQQDMEAEEQCQQEDNQKEEEEEDEDEEEEEGERQEDLNESTNSEPSEEAKLQQPSKEDDAKATEGSAEALLSDLHSFSGTAAWEDTGKDSYITTL